MIGNVVPFGLRNEGLPAAHGVLAFENDWTSIMPECRVLKAEC
jgi:hypothetical protein